ncbi:FAD/NAD(P)-binding domain-containing protein [Mycena venus]|uniref:FAD/NAD(P)-binding domain-containing protein n=1 Tax=Mycena venus TaxID=2733690 RepID=A0A8H7DDY3_9AGAR|nr:FAD/NAD(P)-binding domain-containing protein [Mycena venus]
MTDSESKSKSLRIVIVGAGLAGLAAAVAFRKEGHDVQIFESSSMNKEIGAAIAVTANSLRVLTYLGFDVKNLKATDYLGYTWFNSNGGEGNFDALEDPHDTFGRPGISCHRSDPHDELKRLATMEGGNGSPATIHLKSNVQSCDPTTGKLTLKNGEIHHADLIVGADGIRSTIRTSVLGYEQRALSSGRAAFRCLLEASKLEGRTEFNWLFSGKPGARETTPSSTSSPIVPTNGTRTSSIGTPWPPRRSWSLHSAIIPPPYKGLLELVDGPVHLWQIRALPCLPTWIKGCAALIGDAAHATFPTIGQGAGMAIEDAATVACLLPLGSRIEEIPSRLEAYQALRKARGEFVLTESVEQVTVPLKRGLYSKSKEMQAFVLGHDAVGVAQEHLKTHFTS